MKPAASSPTKTEWPTVAIVGVGLIGGSIGLALQARRLAARVIGVGRSAAALAAAGKAKVVTETSLDLTAAVAEADLVVVATDVGDVRVILAEPNRRHVVSAEDPVGLAAAMNALAGDAELRAALGRANR